MFYKGDKELEEMPSKDNSEGLVFIDGECDNGAYVEWDENEWGPIVKNLNKSKTKCSLYFCDRTFKLNRDVPIVTNGDGLYTVNKEFKIISSKWNKIEYRYAGSNPSNYVKFNNEIWRIIGLVNVKTDRGIEQRIKIIRTDGIDGQKDFGTYSFDTKKEGQGSSVSELGSSDWVDSQLKDMLNGIYYESKSDKCFRGSFGSEASEQTCDFTGNGDLPRGLDELARSMIDSDVIWNIGGYDYENVSHHWNGFLTTSAIYENERGEKPAFEEYDDIVWSKETDVGGKHNGIALMYPSDYTYAVGGEVRNNCLMKEMRNFDEDNCPQNDWLFRTNTAQYTLTPMEYNFIFPILSNGIVSQDFYNALCECLSVSPTAYLRSNVKIKYDSSENYGSIDNPFILIQH